MTFVRSTILLAALSVLAACHGSSPKGDRRSASGEVLQGSVSDAMLPLDKLKSQGPTQAPSQGKGAAKGAPDETSAATEATSETPDTPAGDTTPIPQAASSATP